MMSGTVLVGKLKQYEPGLRVILFSGQADAAELQDAIGKFSRFMDKTDLARLPSIVRASFDEYMVELAEQGVENLRGVGEWRSGFSWRGQAITIEFAFLEDPLKEGPRIWLEDEFELVVRLESGQTREISNTLVTESEILTKANCRLRAVLSRSGLARCPVHLR